MHLYAIISLVVAGLSQDASYLFEALGCGLQSSHLITEHCSAMGHDHFLKDVSMAFNDIQRLNRDQSLRPTAPRGIWPTVMVQHFMISPRFTRPIIDPSEAFAMASFSLVFAKLSPSFRDLDLVFASTTQF